MRGAREVARTDPSVTMGQGWGWCGEAGASPASGGGSVFYWDMTRTICKKEMLEKSCRRCLRMASPRRGGVKRVGKQAEASLPQAGFVQPRWAKQGKRLLETKLGNYAPEPLVAAGRGGSTNGGCCADGGVGGALGGWEVKQLESGAVNFDNRTNGGFIEVGRHALVENALYHIRSTILRGATATHARAFLVEEAEGHMHPFLQYGVTARAPCGIVGLYFPVSADEREVAAPESVRPARSGAAKRGFLSAPGDGEDDLLTCDEKKRAVASDRMGKGAGCHSGYWEDGVPLVFEHVQARSEGGFRGTHVGLQARIATGVIWDREEECVARAAVTNLREREKRVHDRNSGRLGQGDERHAARAMVDENKLACLATCRFPEGAPVFCGDQLEKGRHGDLQPLKARWYINARHTEGGERLVDERTKSAARRVAALGEAEAGGGDDVSGWHVSGFPGDLVIVKRRGLRGGVPGGGLSHQEAQFKVLRAWKGLSGLSVDVDVLENVGVAAVSRWCGSFEMWVTWRTAQSGNLSSSTGCVWGAREAVGVLLLAA
ncbi:hypothetical protein Esti_006115 [Eimeria stiedai]